MNIPIDVLYDQMKRIKKNLVLTQDEFLKLARITIEDGVAYLRVNDNGTLEVIDSLVRELKKRR